MAEVVYIDPAQPSDHLIHQVAKVIKGGGIIIYPTETLYGLGANPFDPEAVERLFRIKGREAGKPIPFLIKDQEMLETLVADVPSTAKQLMEQYWPGPLTLIFRAKEGLPPLLRGEAGTIGVRISTHPIARLIVEAVDIPLTATSANPAGEKDLTDARSIAEILGDQVDLVIDGGNVAGQGSTVVDLTVDPPRVVRAGMIKFSPPFSKGG
ncbi:MAG: threonylcarbamoyl-AMP synthase [Deltaproteobacteria bacterium]|nr:threonylcarbamoyl-AMP synthase [Deltaproteobacteria bacterium]